MATRSPSFLRRLFQFRLRTLLLAMLIFGCGLGWLIRRAELQRKAVAAIRKAGGTVMYDYQIKRDKVDSKDDKSDPNAVSSVPGILRRHLGDDFFHSVVWAEVVVPRSSGTSAKSPNGAWLSRAADLPHLTRLSLRGTDADLEAIGKLRQLECLLVHNAGGVSDEGVRRLGQLTNLKMIGLYDPTLTDDSLKTLARLPRLEHLGILDQRQLTRTRFTVTGLRELGRMTQLRTLALQSGFGRIPGEGILELQDLTSLEELGLGGMHIDEEQLRVLEKFSKLKSLSLRNSVHPDTSHVTRALPGCMVFSGQVAKDDAP